MSIAQLPSTKAMQRAKYTITKSPALVPYALNTKTTDQSHPPGMPTISTRGYDNDTYSDNQHSDHVLFLTDKCNALALRLQQVEAQLLNDSVAGNLRRQPDPPFNSDDIQGATTANPRLYPRSSPASGGPSSSHRTQASWIVAAECRGGSGGAGGAGGGGSLTGRNISEANTIDVAGAVTVNDHPESYHSASAIQTMIRSPSSRLPPGQSIAGGSLTGVANSTAATATAGPRDGVQGRPKNMGVEARHCERVESEIAKRFDIVTDGLEKLENVFSGAAQILEHRVRSITTISRQVWHTAVH